jgi:hypothetical protein
MLCILGNGSFFVFVRIAHGGVAGVWEIPCNLGGSLLWIKGGGENDNSSLGCRNRTTFSSLFCVLISCLEKVFGRIGYYSRKSSM